MGRIFLTAKLTRDVIEGRKTDTYRLPTVWAPKVGEVFGFTIGGRPDVVECRCTAVDLISSDDVEPARRKLVHELIGPASTLQRIQFRVVIVHVDRIRDQHLSAFQDFDFRAGEFGLCQTCGAACDELGCTTDRNHVTQTLDDIGSDIADHARDAMLRHHRIGQYAGSDRA